MQKASRRSMKDRMLLGLVSMYFLYQVQPQVKPMPHFISKNHQQQIPKEHHERKHTVEVFQKIFPAFGKGSRTSWITVSIFSGDRCITTPNPMNFKCFSNQCELLTSTTSCRTTTHYIKKYLIFLEYIQEKKKFLMPSSSCIRRDKE